MKEVLLYSGGPDAHIAWEYLERPEALYVQHNCRYEMKQLFAVKKIIDKLKTSKIRISPTVIDLSVFEENDSNLPLRNMYLIMYAANMGYDKIDIALQKGEQSIPDRTVEFCSYLQSFLSELLNKDISVNPVFFDITKQDMVKWYVENGHDIEILKMTVSCFHPSDNMCSKCSACFRRWVAFEYNDIHEDHSERIVAWEGTQAYVQKMQDGKYDKERSQQTLDVLRRFGLV